MKDVITSALWKQLLYSLITASHFAAQSRWKNRDWAEVCVFDEPCWRRAATHQVHTGGWSKSSQSAYSYIYTSMNEGRGVELHLSSLKRRWKKHSYAVLMIRLFAATEPIVSTSLK